MDPRCTMKLGILFVTAFMLSAAVSMKRHAYFNRTAYLPCPFTKAQNISLSELVVFWQDQKKLVLYEHYLGSEKLNNVNAKYLGRTSFDEDNWTLQLHSVQINDTGSYDCYIQKKTPKGSVILQQTGTELSVTANFSEPEIKEIQNITRNSGINLTCSSKQGYPKPTKMYFWITNSTNELGNEDFLQTSRYSSSRGPTCCRELESLDCDARGSRNSLASLRKKSKWRVRGETGARIKICVLEIRSPALFMIPNHPQMVEYYI
ncbi:T-lymphocyte activation antigen CD86 isoform X1 [Sigmodon hispidus]